MPLKLISALLCTAISFTSCQQEPDEELDPVNNPPGVTGNLKATIDNQPWVANRATIAYRINGIINITGVSTDRKYLTMTLADQGIGTYALNTVELNGAAYVDSTLTDPATFTTNATDDVALAGGTVTITSIDETRKTMSGTFAYRVYRYEDDRSVSFTGGSFTDLSYQSSLPSSNTLDTFRVKIDNLAFVPESIFSVDQSGILAVSASNANASRSLGLQLPSNVLPGEYPLEGLAGQYIGLYNPDNDPGHSLYSKSGTVTIIEHNTTTNRLRGTFSFHGENLLDPSLNGEITDGYFSVKYP